MQCPSCGLGLAGVTLTRCPRCGQPIPKQDAPVETPPPASRTSQLLPPLATVEPRWRGSRRLVVGALAGILVVVCVAACGALYLINAHAKQAQLQPVPGVTATLQGRLTYVNTFALGVDNWAEDANCHIRVDGYHVANGYVCYVPIRNVFDADVYVQVKQVTGSDTRIYGIVFRGYDDTNF